MAGRLLPPHYHFKFLMHEPIVSCSNKQAVGDAYFRLCGKLNSTSPGFHWLLSGLFLMDELRHFYVVSRSPKNKTVVGTHYLPDGFHLATLITEL